jgi:hypothetical protein
MKGVAFPLLEEEYPDFYKFKQYYTVQQSSKYNIFDPKAIKQSGLSEKDYLYVVKNYDSLYKEWFKYL